MPRANEQWSVLPDIKVFIRNPQGHYLARDSNGLFFTNDRALALVMNYRSDAIPEQLEQVRRTQGLVLVADPVPLDEVYETCDRCRELFTPFMMYFDGKRFLCEDCRLGRAARANGRA